MMMYPSQPRTLTPREVEAINAQCINRIYDEFDREDHGRPNQRAEK